MLNETLLVFKSLQIFSCHSFSCRCAKTAKDNGYDYIGVQYYGECWSSRDAINRYNLYGPRDNCVTTLFTPGNTAFKECSDNNSLACTGALFSNYVYEIVSGKKKSEPIRFNFASWLNYSQRRSSVPPKILLMN